MIFGVHPPSSKTTTHSLSAGTLVAILSTLTFTTHYGTRMREIISFFSPKPSSPQRHHCDTVTQCPKSYQHNQSILAPQPPGNSHRRPQATRPRLQPAGSRPTAGPHRQQTTGVGRQATGSRPQTQGNMQQAGRQ